MKTFYMKYIFISTLKNYKYFEQEEEFKQLIINYSL